MNTTHTMLGRPDSITTIPFDPSRIIERGPDWKREHDRYVSHQWFELKRGDIVRVEHAGREVYFELLKDGCVSVSKYASTWPTAVWSESGDDYTWEMFNGVRQVGEIFR